MQSKPITFRTILLVKLLSIIGCISFGGIFILWNGRESVIYFMSGLIALISLLGTIDAFISRVTLEEDTIIVVSNFHKKIYPRALFSSVICEKGCPVYLKFVKDGGISLPTTIGINVNSLRKWVKS